MFWLLLTILLVIAGVIALSRRRNYRAREVEDEPWRASLDEDEPLDLDAAREAEERWLAEEWEEDDAEDEPWRR
ncbi:MAG: hypothetical protein H0X65_18305 [Gemmatimonadetes bacterium]|nr:hypothetical protein [Gemmatimonadota bacterium]